MAAIAGTEDLPAPRDRRRRPAGTGLTRADWETYADRLLDACKPYASASYARIAMPGAPSWSGPDSDALEGFARSFLLASIRIAGTRGDAGELLDRYASGLAAGTDPRHPDAWPRADDAVRQPVVEAASIAIGLHLTRPWLWDQLGTSIRAHVVDWLGAVVGRDIPDNNWVLFKSVVGEFLASVDGPHDADEIVGGLRRIEDWHLGGGWYTDGDGRRIDHYNGWALHFYPHLWADLAAGGPRAALAEEVSTRCRARLRDFLADYVHLIGGDGAPLHQGRSLTYRMAAAAPLWTGVLYDATPLPPGLSRRAANGILHSFMSRGVPDETGLLSLGWLHPHRGTVQRYSGPASPLWASKGFLGLLLPADHPAWTDPELPLPVEQGDVVHEIPTAGWLVQATAADGIVRVHNHGSDGINDTEFTDDPHYARLAYSTAVVPRTSALADNHVGVTTPDGNTTGRGRIHLLGGGSASWHQPAPGIRIESSVHVRGRYEVRVHRIRAPRGWVVTETGYNLSGSPAGSAQSGRHWTAYVDGRGWCTAIAPLHGWAADDAGVDLDDDSDALGGRSGVPFLRGVTTEGESVFATCVVLSGERLDRDAPPPAELDPKDLSVRWSPAVG